MINIEIKNSRDYIQANVDTQQILFTLLKLTPLVEKFPTKRSLLSLAIVVDVSGSMNESYQGKTKKEYVVDALSDFFKRSNFSNEDYFSIIAFDTNSKVVLPLTQFTSAEQTSSSVRELLSIGGGMTAIASGLDLAVEQLKQSSKKSVKRILLFTDGISTVEGDEDKCRSIAARCKDENIVISPIGVGEEYNEDLLHYIADKTCGIPYHLRNIGEFLSKLYEELNFMLTELVTNVRMELEVPKLISVEEVSKVTPSYSLVEKKDNGFFLGNISTSGVSVILKFGLRKYPPAKIKVCTIKLTYDVPSMEMFNNTQSYEVWVESTTDAKLYQRIDPEVMKYVQASNVTKLIYEATQAKDKTIALEKLTLAKQLTQHLGASSVTKAITDAEKELQLLGKISPELTKHLKTESKTKTLRQKEGSLLSEEDIRKITGV